MKSFYIAALVLFTLIHFGQAAAQPKPNVVFIVADDMGYADCGVHGSTDIPTPNIDSIASSGVRLTDGYVTGPVCSPTRAAMMTGRYQHRDGVMNWVRPESEDGLAEGVPTLADYLRRAGYHTALIGKWHLGNQPEHHPRNRGFDEFFGFTGGGRSYYMSPGERNQTGPGNPSTMRRGFDPTGFEGYLTTALGAETASYITSRKEKDSPFFVILSFNAPHTPMQAAPGGEAKFAHIEDPKRRTYAAMMSAMDDAVGDVLNALRETGQDANTLVAFFSDNGGPTTRNSPNGSSNHPFRGSKGEVWEGGVRVPMFVSWPGRLPTGRVLAYPVTQMDLTATVLALAGVEPDAEWPIDGRDVMPVLSGAEVQAAPDPIYWAYENRQWAVRDGQWKLVAMAVNPKAFANLYLYDLSHDPGEQHDLAAAQPERVTELLTKLEAWCREVDVNPPRVKK